MRVRRSSMSSSGETTISVCASMLASRTRNSARLGEDRLEVGRSSAVGWNAVDQYSPLSTSRR
jgi:hypothetical protein